jgi:hypothetical protein
MNAQNELTDRMIIYCIFRGPYLLYAVSSEVEAMSIIDKKEAENEKQNTNNFWYYQEILMGDKYDSDLR